MHGSFKYLLFYNFLVKYFMDLFGSFIAFKSFNWFGDCDVLGLSGIHVNKKTRTACFLEVVYFSKVCLLVCFSLYYLFCLVSLLLFFKDPSE